MRIGATILLVGLLPMITACTTPRRGITNPPPIKYEAQFEPTSVALRPGGSGQVFKVRFREVYSNTFLDLRTRGNDSFGWTLVNVPSGADGGRFVFPDKGFISPDATLDTTGMYILQLYYPPASLPPGATRLNLKVNVGLSPHLGGEVAVGEAEVIIDPTAPGLAPPPEEMGSAVP